MGNPFSGARAETESLQAGAAPATRRTAVILYGAVAFLYWVSLFTYLPTLPTYAATLTSDLALIGTILSMYGLWQALARLPAGIAADWAGRRKPFIVIGLALSAGGALIMAAAQTPQVLLVGRSVTGLAAATWVPLTVVFSALYPPEQAVRATTTLTLVSAFGRVFGTVTTGPLNALNGYSLAFIVAAVLAVLAIVLVLPAAETRRPAKAPNVTGIVRLATRHDVLLPAGLSAIAHYILMGIVFGFVALLAKDLGASGSMVSNLSVVHLAVFTPSVLAASLLLRRFDKRPLLVFSFGALALGVACGAVATSIAWLVAVQVLVGLGFGICYPILMGMSIEQVDAAERTTAMGVHQSVYAIGMFVGPWLSGILAAAIGMRPMFAVTAIATLALGILGTLWATQRRAATGKD